MTDSHMLINSVSLWGSHRREMRHGAEKKRKSSASSHGSSPLKCADDPMVLLHGAPPSSLPGRTFPSHQFWQQAYQSGLRLFSLPTLHYSGLCLRDSNGRNCKGATHDHFHLPRMRQLVKASRIISVSLSVNLKLVYRRTVGRR